MPLALRTGDHDVVLVLGRLDPPGQHPEHRVGDRRRGMLVGHAPLVGLPPPADLGRGACQEALDNVLDWGAGLEQPEGLTDRRLAVPPREGVDEPLHLSCRDLHRLPPVG